MSAACVLSVHPLPCALPGHASLTYPRWRHWLQPPEGADSADPSSPVAVQAVCAADDGGTPVGLALLHLPPGHTGRLLSVMVLPDRRRQGIGSALLRAAADCARHAGAPALMAQHNSAATGIDAYDAFMAANGWPAAETREVRGFGRAGWGRTAGKTFARHRAALVRRGYALTPWTDLTEDDAAAIRALVASGAVPDGYDPFLMHGLDAPDLSAVLYRHGAVVGWAKAHWQDTARTQAFYHSGWVLPEVARQGWLAVAMIDLSARQADLYGDDSLTGLATDANNLPMQGILFNRFGMLAERFDRLMQRTLPL
ncbi:GNAT family N-acetyltransferase [Novispirillum itersonii]|uniref:GNAT superfamily N-acetyltransferase n=1 Tax=Novispirillum itersonii TaxID=189 RepID=A0A7W9ZEB5_NOVIT|nr:GNAT family N-acetyltransferase [Novispirillum itersonii]MBB6208709.1 GNAT superfamily N-acetyltransferase [Novispirillum itersonii]